VILNLFMKFENDLQSEMNVTTRYFFRRLNHFDFKIALILLTSLLYFTVPIKLSQFAEIEEYSFTDILYSFSLIK
jgi:hypothetical protein